MTSSIKCCYKCEDRHLGCHSECERYKQERERYEKQKEIEKKAKERHMDTFDRFRYWR